MIGEELGLSQKEIKILSISAELHDIGKSKILDEILKKNSKLNKDEMLEMYRHPLHSYQIIREIPGFEEVSRIILHHHEHYNGSGYPSGLRGSEIPLLSRIITVADVFDAMTSKRIYRKRKYSDKEAIKHLKKKSGILYDPDVVEAFIRVYEKGYIFLERGNYFFSNHYYYNAQKHYQIALKTISEKRKNYLVRLRMAAIHNRQRNYKDAIKILMEGLKRENPYLGNYYIELTLSYHYMDNLEEMGRYVKLALKEDLTIQDRIRGLRHLLIYYHRVGKPEKALELYKELERMISDFFDEMARAEPNIVELSDRIAQKKSIDLERAKLYDYVARVMRDLGFLNESIVLFERSIELKTIYGNFLGKAISLGGLGEVYILLGEYETARDIARETLSLSKMIRNRLGIYLAHLKLLEIHSLMGEFREAEKHLMFLHMYRKHIVAREAQQRLNYSKGIYYYKKGNLDRAIECLDYVIQSSNNIFRRTQAEFFLAKCYKEKGDSTIANNYYNKCKDTFKKYRMLYLSRLVEEEMTNT